MFNVGDRVVCVSLESNAPARYIGNLRPKIEIGAVFTIREIDTRALHFHNVAALRFEEIRGPSWPTKVGMWEGAAFPADRFRPVIKRQTSIKVFTDMLVPAREPV